MLDPRAHVASMWSCSNRIQKHERKKLSSQANTPTDFFCHFLYRRRGKNHPPRTENTMSSQELGCSDEDGSRLHFNGVCQANNLAHGRTLGLATNASVALLKRRKKFSVMPDDRPFSVPRFSFFCKRTRVDSKRNLGCFPFPVPVSIQQ